jgi:hypothetical protein
MTSPGDPSELFQFIWGCSIAVRNRNLRFASELMEGCLLKQLHDRPLDLDAIFRTLATRYFLVRSFYETYHPLVDLKSIREPVEVRVAEIPITSSTGIRDVISILEIPQSPSAGELSQRPSGVRASTTSRGATPRMSTPLGIGRVAPSLSLLPAPVSQLNHSLSQRILCASVPNPVPPDNRTPPEASDPREAFLTRLADQSRVSVLQNEAEVLLRVYRYLNDRQAKIVGLVDSSLSKLESYYSKLSYAKCDNEMETFSERFRLFKSGELNEGSLFEIATCVLDSDVQSLCAVLDGNIPRPSEIPEIDSTCLIEIWRTFSVGKPRFISLRDLVTAAEKVGLGPVDIAKIRAVVQMVLYPDLIDLKSFIQVFALGRQEILSVLDETEEEARLRKAVLVTDDGETIQEPPGSGFAQIIDSAPQPTAAE